MIRLGCLVLCALCLIVAGCAGGGRPRVGVSVGVGYSGYYGGPWYGYPAYDYYDDAVDYADTLPAYGMDMGGYDY